MSSDEKALEEFAENWKKIIENTFNMSKKEPATPEKKRDWKSDQEDYRDGKMKPQCQYCGYEYTDPTYCSVSGRTADKHKWI